MHVKDHMSTQIVTANLRDGLHQTFFRMRERGIRHMPVLDAEGRLVGMVSDRDLRRPRTLSDDPNHTEYYALDNNTFVEEVMSREPVSAAAGDALSAVLPHFTDDKLGALPIVDENRRVVGLLSSVDLLRAFQKTLS